MVVRCTAPLGIRVKCIVKMNRTIRHITTKTPNHKVGSRLTYGSVLRGMFESKARVIAERACQDASISLHGFNDVKSLGYEGSSDSTTLIHRRNCQRTQRVPATNSLRQVGWREGNMSYRNVF